MLQDGNAGSFFKVTAECKPVNGKRIRWNEGNDSRQWAEYYDHGAWRTNVW